MNELKVTGRILPISESTKRRNPDLYGGAGLGAKEHTKPAPALVQNLSPKHSGKVRVVVCIVSFRKRILDDDNYHAGCKPLRDAIAKSLGIDDGDKRIKFHYEQLPAIGREQTIVRIEAKT